VTDAHADLREQIIQLRAIAARQELMLGLEDYRGIDPRHRSFVELAISMCRIAATMMDQALEIRREAFAALGHYEPPPGPRLRVIEGGAADVR